MSGRKARTTSNHHGPYVQGYTRTTMVGHRGLQYRKMELIPKTDPSSDCGLQFVHMKEESLVIANQKVAVNTFPGLVHTARHTTKASCNRSTLARESEVVIGDWGEVVTR